MAKRIEAIRYYRPRLKRMRRVEPDEFAGYVAGISSLTKGEREMIVTTTSAAKALCQRESPLQMT